MIGGFRPERGLNINGVVKKLLVQGPIAGRKTDCRARQSRAEENIRPKIFDIENARPSAMGKAGVLNQGQGRGVRNRQGLSVRRTPDVIPPVEG